MSRRYGERGYERYGDDEGERDYEARERREDESYGGRHIRGLGYGDPARGQSPGRDYDYGRDYGYGRDYAPRDSVSRDYDARDYGTREYEPREYGRQGYGARGREGDEYAAERGREYGREQSRDYGREREHSRGREHDRERDPNRVRSFDTDYGRTTSRFYGRSGYEYGRDDYDRPNYGPEVTEYRSRTRDEHEGRGDRRDERDERGRGGRGWWDRAADGLLSWFGDDDAARRLHAEGGREVGSRDREAGSRERGEGLYRGRGPKNYRRPDDRIREEINDRLTDNDWLDASDVDVTVVAGEAVLTGTVDSRYSKRLAEDIAESVTGVSNVQNNLRVQSYQTGTPSAAPQAGDANAAAGDVTLTDRTAAPTFTDVIKNAVTNASTTTPDLEGPSGPDDAAPNSRASRAGGGG